MDVAEMNTRRIAAARARRHALLEDLDWMRVTGETPERALLRLRAMGYRYGRMAALADFLRVADFDADRAEQLAVVREWLVPPRVLAAIPDERARRARVRALVSA